MSLSSGASVVDGECLSRAANAMRRFPATLARMPSIFDSNNLEVTPEQTQTALVDDSAQIVDVREPHEWEAGRIDGALHVELNELGASAAKIDTDRPVIFYCLAGSRSAMAAQAFRGVGVDAYSMAGGMQRWQEEQRPIAPEGGTVVGH
jgi:rhodanese-related sulfurtransferase